MKVKVEDVGTCRKILRVEVPADVVASQYVDILNGYTKVARIPGFRVGRATSAIVENHFQKDIVEEAKERLVPQYYWKALEEQKLRPVAVIEISDVTFGKGQALAFKAVIDIAPDFKLPKYKKISVKPVKVEVVEKDVDAAIDRVKMNLARFEDANERDSIAGDLVMVDFRGMCGDSPVASISPDSAAIGEGKDFWVFLGDPEFLPGFALGLSGQRVGSHKTINVRFPSDFRVKAVAGKEAVYEVTVKAIRARILPDMDAEFFKKFEVDSLEALKAKIRSELMENAVQKEDFRLKDEIARTLLEKTDFELPKSVVDHETSVTARSIVERIAMQGATREQIEQRRGDILNEAVKTSTERVKLSYILSRIADEEKIEVQDPEVDSRIEMMAGRYGMSAERFRAELEKKDAVSKLRSEMRSEKTLDFLLKNAKD